MLDAVEEINNVDVVQVRGTTENKLSVNINAGLTATFVVSIYKTDWPAADEDPRISPLDLDWSDTEVVAALTLTLQCELELIVDPLNMADYSLNLSALGLSG
jgi:hypothetical protein